MKIRTKALISLLVITMLTVTAATVPASALSSSGDMAGQANKKLEKLQQHHDRKMELRASVLGMSPDELKMALKAKSFNQILKEKGFASRQAYHLALFGKVKEELRRRGWDDKKIQQFIQKRLERLSTH